MILSFRRFFPPCVQKRYVKNRQDFFWQKLSLYFRYNQFQQSLRQLHVNNIESSRWIQAAKFLSAFLCVSIDNTHWMRIDAYLCTPIMIVLTTSSILCNVQCSVTRSYFFFTLVVFLSLFILIEKATAFLIHIFLSGSDDITNTIC